MTWCKMPVQLTWNGNHSPLWKRRLTMPLLIFLHETGRTSAESVYFTSREQLEANVAEYIEYFYGMRPYQRFGMRTPSEAERNFADK